MDNTRNNLRICTVAENSKNRKKNRNIKSGFKGVDLQGNRWRATIKLNKKQIHLGYYSTPEEAHQVYKNKSNELFGEFSYYRSVNL